MRKGASQAASCLAEAAYWGQLYKKVIKVNYD
jgi:hypothetical protein